MAEHRGQEALIPACHLSPKPAGQCEQHKGKEDRCKGYFAEQQKYMVTCENCIVDMKPSYRASEIAPPEIFLNEWIDQ